MVTGFTLLALAAVLPSRRHPVSLYRHVPHPHLKHRAENGAPTVAGAVEKQSFNMRLAARGTRLFGSMPAFYLFVIYGALGAILVKYQATLLYWSNWIQLWSLPLLMVGGIVLGIAHDKMAQQQFDDTEAMLHQQDQVAQHLAAQDEKILAILDRIEQNTALTEEVKAAVAAGGMVPAKRLATKAERADKGYGGVT
jgi:hypothetical protein